MPVETTRRGVHGAAECNIASGPSSIFHAERMLPPPAGGHYCPLGGSTQCFDDREMEARIKRSLGVSLLACAFSSMLACASSSVGSRSSGTSGGGMAGALASAGGGQASSTGGMPSNVGTAGASVGGSAAGGSGLAGSTSGGVSSAAGSTGSGGSTLSAGCGKAAGLVNGRASIDVAGTMREYILALPNNYDKSHAYKLIFGWHPLGGSAQQVASGGYYGLLKEAKDQAILVSPEGLPFQLGGGGGGAGGSGSGGDGGSGGARPTLGWGNTNGADLAFLRAMLDLFRAQLCVDEERIFSTGFSFGGMMSFAVGCSSTSMMRAIAPMAGNTVVSGCEKGTRPVAMMGFHGDRKSVV